MSTIRSDADDAARRSYLGVSRATLVEADDKPKMHELTARARFGAQHTHVEHWGHYGISHVPLPPDKDGEAEVLIAYLGGSPDHPIVVGVADRRHRPKDMKPGDVAFHDHRGSLTTFTKGGITHRTPLTITHNTVDKDGKVTSSVVQEPSGKVTITNKDGTTLVMDGPNLKTKPGKGGKHIMDGDVSVTGGLDATKAITALSMLAGGLPVKTG